MHCESERERENKEEEKEARRRNKRREREGGSQDKRCRYGVQDFPNITSWSLREPCPFVNNKRSTGEL